MQHAMAETLEGYIVAREILGQKTVLLDPPLTLIQGRRLIFLGVWEEVPCFSCKPCISLLAVLLGEGAGERGQQSSTCCLGALPLGESSCRDHTGEGEHGRRGPGAADKGQSLHHPQAHTFHLTHSANRKETVKASLGALAGVGLVAQRWGLGLPAAEGTGRNGAESQLLDIPA